MENGRVEIGYVLGKRLDHLNDWRRSWRSIFFSVSGRHLDDGLPTITASVSDLGCPDNGLVFLSRWTDMTQAGLMVGLDAMAKDGLHTQENSISSIQS